MTNSNKASNKEMMTWKIINIIGDLFGILGTIAFFGVSYKMFVTKELDILNTQFAYLMIFIVMILLLIGKLLTCGIEKSLTRFKKSKLDLEDRNILNIHDELNGTVEKELKKIQIKTKFSIILKNIFLYGAVYGIMFLTVLLDENGIFVNNFLLGALIAIASFIATICSFVGLVDVKDRKVQMYTKKYRDTVILPVLNRIDDKLTFIFDVDELDGEINSKAVKNKFEESKISTEKYDGFFVDDVIVDNSDNSNIYEINVAKKVRVNGRKRYASYFRGLFAEFKSSQNTVQVVKIGSNAIKNYSHDFTAKTDFGDFEKYFYVMAEKDEDKDIITESLAKALVELYEKYNIPFEIVFKGEKAYARLLTGELFEPALSGDIVNKNDIATCYYSINLIRDLKNIM